MSLLGHHSPQRVILYSLLGMLLGLGSYMTLSLATYVLLFPLLLCLLFAKSGLVPMLTAIAGFALSFTYLFGAATAALMSIMLIIPALLTIFATCKGLPYFQQLKISLFSFGGSVLLLLLIVGALSGGNLVDSVLEIFRASFHALPDTMQDALLVTLYPDLAGVNASDIPILGDIVRSRYLNDFLNELRGTLMNEMLPMLMKSSLITALLCSYFTARPLALRNEIPQTAFIPLSQWFMPGSLCVGLLLTTFAAYLIDSFSSAGGVSTFLTMFSIMECLFCAQVMAAWDRMLNAGKASYRRKCITLGALYVLASGVITGIGICSAIFGRQGLLMKMKNHRN